MKHITIATAATLLMVSCNTTNPLLQESTLPYGAPQFDKIRNEHYMPAFRQGIEEAKAEIDAIVANTDAPSFENTIEAMERSGKTLNRVSNIFFNVLEADSDEQMQRIAEEVSPLLNEYEMYVSQNLSSMDGNKNNLIIRLNFMKNLFRLNNCDLTTGWFLSQDNTKKFQCSPVSRFFAMDNYNCIDDFIIE